MSEEAYFIRGDETILLKKAIARNLYSSNIDQSKISEILNLSQPMVSNYCKSKEELPDYITNLANIISEKIDNYSTINFHTCVSFSKDNLEGKLYIAKKNELLTEENRYIVNNLTEAFLLIKGKNIKKLLPEVKINLAMSKKEAKNSDDIASFTNGIIVLDDKISHINGIRFGTSKHLSSMLLYLKEKLDINAIINISFIDNIGEYDLKYAFLTKDFKLAEEINDIDILLHKGDFGIEPCSYIVGRGGIDVIKKLMEILEVIK